MFSLLWVWYHFSVCFLPITTNNSRAPVGVLQFNTFAIVSVWRAHQLPWVTGSVLQDWPPCPPLQTPATSPGCHLCFCGFHLLGGPTTQKHLSTGLAVCCKRIQLRNCRKREMQLANYVGRATELLWSLVTQFSPSLHVVTSLESLENQSSGVVMGAWMITSLAVGGWTWSPATLPSPQCWVVLNVWTL